MDQAAVLKLIQRRKLCLTMRVQRIAPIHGMLQRHPGVALQGFKEEIVTRQNYLSALPQPDPNRTLGELREPPLMPGPKTRIQVADPLMGGTPCKKKRGRANTPKLLLGHKEKQKVTFTCEKSPQLMNGTATFAEAQEPPQLSTCNQTHARTHARTHTYTHTRIHTYTHTHIHTYTQIPIYAYIHIHAYTHGHIHAYTHTHTHIRIHTHTFRPGTHRRRQGQRSWGLIPGHAHSGLSLQHVRRKNSRPQPGKRAGMRAFHPRPR